MAQPTLRLVDMSLRVARMQTPAAFFQQCRAKSSTGRTFASRAVTSHSIGQEPSRTFPDPRNLRARTFSSGSPARATVVKQNPRADDDGNDMTIEISEKAARVR